MLTLYFDMALSCPCSGCSWLGNRLPLKNGLHGDFDKTSSYEKCSDTAPIVAEGLPRKQADFLGYFQPFSGRCNDLGQAKSR